MLRRELALECDYQREAACARKFRCGSRLGSWVVGPLQRGTEGPSVGSPWGRGEGFSHSAGQVAAVGAWGLSCVLANMKQDTALGLAPRRWASSLGWGAGGSGPRV